MPRGFKKQSGSMSSLSIPGKIAAVDLNLRVVEKHIDRAFKALYGNGGDTFAGASNDTPEGVRILKQHLDSFETRKAQLEEETFILQGLLSQHSANGLGGLLLPYRSHARWRTPGGNMKVNMCLLC